jgi:mannose/fructose/N-acetylgalactosamine-specific phosphotransferase system component IID
VTPLGNRDFLRMALRASLLEATWNYERQQGVGWAWALKPALERIYGLGPERNERLAEHTAFFNTQPTMASLALGAIAGIEEQRAAGVGPNADAIGRMKSMLGSALAVLGDRLFGHTLRPLAGCLGVALALPGSWLGAVALLLFYNGIHQSVRWLGVRWGYELGPAVLSESLRRRVDRFARLLSVLGAMLVGVIVAIELLPGGEPRALPFQLMLAGGLVIGVIVAQRPRPSPSEWALVVAGIACVVGWSR